MMRMILHHCFGLRSTSVYRHDLRRLKHLEQYAGHFEIDAPPDDLPKEQPWLIKTHTAPPDGSPAIYIARDGRAAIASFYAYRHAQQRVSGLRFFILRMITGYHNDHIWSKHVQAWCPWERPHTLLIHYEDMVKNLPKVLTKLAAFLKRPIISTEIPDRRELAAKCSPWVRDYTDWRNKFSPDEMWLFAKFNGALMAKLGYPVNEAPTPGLFRRTRINTEVLYCWLYWQIQGWGL